MDIGPNMKVDIFNTEKKYKVIYADPAWKFNNKNTGGSMSSGSQNQYHVSPLEDMKNLPIKDITADNCLLVMWYVSAMPQEAIDLVNAWGFTLKNMNGFVWEKLTKNGLPHFGMGFYTRAGSESAIIAIKGKPKIISHSVRAVRRSPIRRHSEKPAAFRDDIVNLVGDVPRIELFARHHIDGWDCWGDEV